MPRVCFVVLIASLWVTAAVSAGPPAPTPQPASASSAGPSRVLLDQYCIACHNQRIKTAGLMLDTLDLDRVGEKADVWEKVVRKLRTGAMPPAGARRPDKVTVEGFVSQLETALDRAAAADPKPGRPSLHRLNRTEYANAIRDLLTLDVDASSLLPADDSSYGFDNIADVLGVSPTLLERYLAAAQKVSRVAVGNPAIRRSVATYRAPLDLTQEDELEGMPPGTRGGLQFTHQFPLSGEYAFKAKLGRNVHEVIRGLSEQHELEVSLDGVRIQVFQVGGGGLSREERHGQFRQADFEVRAPVTAGPHVVTVTFLKRGSAQLEVASPGEGGSYVAALRPPFLRSNIDPYNVDESLPYIAQVLIDGPFGATGTGDTPSRQRIFVCRPAGRADDQRCATQILTTLARRAYRRPVTQSDVAPLLRFYEATRRDGEGFDRGIETALRALLVQPEFLFRFERDPAGLAPGAVYRLSDLELASRLSFFLWSSIPDDELLMVASKGQLRERAVLEAQARRMLADARSQSLVTNFADQWLQLRNLQFTSMLYHDFDDNLRKAMRRETQLLFESMLRENRSVVDLLTANYTFVNERLARHYGMPNVQGSHFRRVTLSDDSPRRGLLGQGSILTVTSYGSRTSPVVRGKWILENILGTPPPPPPPDVPPLKEETEGGKALSMRERMAQHRSNPACATCHVQMDPLGLALEPFDFVGRYRTRSEANEPIDASGALPDGTKFDGPTGLRMALVNRSDAFVHVMTERLLTYAVGRGLEHYDAPAIRAILRQSARSQYALPSIILSVVQSLPFQMRQVLDRPAAATTAAAGR